MNKIELKFKDSMLAEVMEKLPIGIGVYEIIDGNVVPCCVNDRALDIFGMTREEYESTDLNNEDSHKLLGFTKEDVKAFSAKQYIESGSAYEHVVKVHKKSGENIWIRCISVFEPDDDAYICYTTIRDVTKAMQSKQEEEKRHETYQLIIEEFYIRIFDYNPQEDILVYSSQMQDGKTEEYVILNYCQNIKNRKGLHEDSQDIIKNAIKKASNKPTKDSIEYLADYTGGGFRWYRAAYKSVTDEEGNIFRIVGTVRDIQAEKERFNKLRKKAEVDTLSGIYNRNTAMDSINQRLANGAEKDSYVFMIFDIDNFKSINDTYGHPIGDLAIKAVAGAIRDEFRHSDVVGRLGGDEFCGFFETEYGVAAASEKAANFIDKIHKTSVELALGVKISVSIGVAMAPKHGKNFNDLYKKADQAMYRAKARGKDCFVVYGENYD